MGKLSVVTVPSSPTASTVKTLPLLYTTLPYIKRGDAVNVAELGFAPVILFSEQSYTGVRFVSFPSFFVPYLKTSPVVKTQLSMYGGEVEIWRIGDKQSEALSIPPQYKKQIKKITKYCTLPELEMLLIISEKMYKEYDKTKTQKHTKQFAKENIVFNKKKYKGDTKFYEEYYGRDIPKLIKAIQEYKHRNHSHGGDQHYLLEIVKP